MNARFANLVILTVCLHPCSAQTIRTVGAGAGSFADIPLAIAASAPGDRVEVHGSGWYSAFTVAIGIDVEALAGAMVPSIGVLGVPSGQQARVAGFRVQPQVSNLASLVAIHNCQGRVLLVDMQVYPFITLVTRPTLEIVSSNSVWVERGQFRAVTSWDPFLPALGVQMNASSAVFDGTAVLGGLQTVGSWVQASDAIQLINGSRLLLRNATINGHAGLLGTLYANNGGDAIDVSSDSSALVMGGTSLVGGSPGMSGAGVLGLSGYAARGPVQYTQNTALTGPTTASVVAIPNRPELNLPATAAVGSAAALSIQGDPNQIVWLAFDFAHDFATLPTPSGVYALTGAAMLVPPIALDPLGSATIQILVPNVSSLRNLNLFGQGAAFVAGSLVLTAPGLLRTT